jgi:ABC-type multidrug transport system permease subunit
LTWIGAWIGLSVPNSETANTAGFVWLFPLTFLSNAFVPLQGMPSWLQHVATWNPVTSNVQAARKLFGNPTIPVNHSLPMDHPVIVSVFWTVLVLAIFIPLSVRKYARVAAK